MSTTVSWKATGGPEVVAPGPSSSYLRAVFLGADVLLLGAATFALRILVGGLAGADQGTNERPFTFGWGR
jgi:hypothetical protein